jgi:hypothetical protein
VIYQPWSFSGSAQVLNPTSRPTVGNMSPGPISDPSQLEQERYFFMVTEGDRKEYRVSRRSSTWIVIGQSTRLMRGMMFAL